MIRIDLFEGRTVAQKRTCADAVTRAFLETCGGTKKSVSIIFTDVAKRDWATAGRLAIDPKPPVGRG